MKGPLPHHTLSSAEENTLPRVAPGPILFDVFSKKGVQSLSGSRGRRRTIWEKIVLKCQTYFEGFETTLRCTPSFLPRRMFMFSSNGSLVLIVSLCNRPRTTPLTHSLSLSLSFILHKHPPNFLGLAVSREGIIQDE